MLVERGAKSAVRLIIKKQGCVRSRIFRCIDSTMHFVVYTRVNRCISGSHSTCPISLKKTGNPLKKAGNPLKKDRNFLCKAKTTSKKAENASKRIECDMLNLLQPHD